MLGDVIVSTDRAIAQAQRYGRTPEREILTLVAHGVLHLLGHDHESSRERTKMRNLENRYLRTLLKTAQMTFLISAGIGFAVLLYFSGLFSGSETAFFSLSKLDLSEMYRRRTASGA